jgi:carboxyl-terminal processing protease
MKKKILTVFFPVVLLGIFAFTLYNSGKREKILLQALSQTLAAGHFENYALDKEMSEKVYDLYIERLDYSKRYLLKEDLKKLEKFRFILGEEIKQANYDFFDLSVEMIEGRIKETESIYKQVLKNPFDFKKNEEFETDPEKLDFAKNEKERYERWRKLLKYQTMLKLDRLLTIQETAIKDKDTTYKVLNFSELEEKARGDVENDYNDLYHRLYKLNDNDRLATYLNAFTGSYDPHSEYMPPRDKENFDIRMSGQLEGIGATLTEQKGYVKVARIVPGSPSWKQGELKSNDLILKVAQGDSTPVSIVDMRLDDAVQLIRGKKGTEVRLTVKKPDNSIVVIPIIRDIVVIEETYAKSAILQVDGSSKRYGYINLPSFYVDFNNRNGRRCSEDVEIEIEKLKAEDVDGIILDLRLNGGGSLTDVVDMAGFFIKNGPIVQVKSRIGDPYILKDRDSRIQYDGDLVVMVNTLSASASEILAAAMQDYGRAIIVGAPSTYGKGTVQRIIDLDQVVSDSYSDIKPLGALRITIQKFYRVNGGATQLKGVVPDIILPDIYGSMDIGERELTNVMPWDEIPPADYQKWPLPIENMTDLKANSSKRVADNEVFNKVKENSLRLKKHGDITTYSLNLEMYREKQEKLNKEAEKFNKMLEADTKLKAFSLQEDLRGFGSDTTKIKTAENWRKDLQKDAYLEEAVFVMQDIWNFRVTKKD